MAKVSTDLQAISNRSVTDLPLSDDSAWVDVECHDCASAQMVAVMRSTEKAQTWLRCPSCKSAAVSQDGEVFPRNSGLRNPKGQPAEDQYVWDEVRDCMTVNAHSAVVMLCRKLLFHLAVTHGLPAKKANGHAPTFAEAVRHLQNEGYVTVHMRPWVDKIRDIGNEASHEIPQISQQDAETVAKFTEQLLLMTYEYPLALAEVAPLDRPSADEPG